MKRFIHILFLTCILGILTGCISKEAKPYLGRWQMTYEQHVLTAEFHKDGTCTLSDDQKSWNGTWDMENDEIILKTESDSLIGSIDEQGQLLLFEYIDGIKGTAPVTLTKIVIEE